MAYKTMVVTYLDVLGTKNLKTFESKYALHNAFHGTILDYEKMDRKEAAYNRKVFSFSDSAFIFPSFRENIELQQNADELLK